MIQDEARSDGSKVYLSQGENSVVNSSSGEIILDGGSLRLEDISRFLNDNIEIGISPGSFEAAIEGRRFLEEEMEKKIIYGVNTGFGPMASHIIGREELIALQKNLIRSHSAGMGEPVDSRFVLAAMLIRLNTLVKGFSGASPELLRHFLLFVNNRIIPLVPEHGAVGTSGDLVQLAHIALSLMGEGRVFYRGAVRETGDVLAELGITPYELKPKEGLALINGTSFMAGVGAVLLSETARILDICIRLGALALEITKAFDDYIAKEPHDLRPHKGQCAIAERMREILESSRSIEKRSNLVLRDQEDSVREIDDDVQSVYSFRCLPQILGPILDELENVKKTVEIEINSVTDNPIIHPQSGNVFHGGNFHGEVIAAAFDNLKARIVKLTMLSERQTNFFLNKNVNKRFPPFLNLKQPGLTLGLQGLQFVATSTTAQSQTLAFPMSVHSIPTNADNQDVVSMGTDAALMTAKVVENAYIVLAIEAVVLAQAVDVSGESDKLSEQSKNFHKEIRGIFPSIIEDREISHELPAVVSFLKEGGF